MPLSADTIRSLEPYDLRVLHSLERLMKRYRWVPFEDLKGDAGLSGPETLYRLGRLMDRGMARYEKVPYEGYALVFGGYDALALHALSERGIVAALGAFVGVGKESVIYRGLGLSELALKFHRVGQRSFHSARAKRGYLPQKGHIPWIFASAHSARREFEALTLLHPAVSVPLPVTRNRNLVVMGWVAGTNLHRCTVEEPAGVLREVLDQVARAYRCGVIHGDLSEFNLMVGEEGGVTLIDWPQWVETTHPNASEYLRNDLGNILAYFRRKYRLDYTLGEALAEVTG
jgi:RIO kinase 2